MGFKKSIGAEIRNEAMRDDPEEIYGWRMFGFVLTACFGGMIFGWDTGAIGGILAMDSAKKQFGYDNLTPAGEANLSQNIVSTLQAGCFAACLATPWITEKWGRRPALIGAGVMTIIGVIFQTTSAIHGDLPVMYVGRFIAGLGCGAASTLTPLYVAECAPRAIRGGLIAIYQLFNVFAIMIAFWVNYGSTQHLSAPAVYIVPLAMQALPPIFLMAGMSVCPESPRWCARKDYWERATEILCRIRNLPADSPYVREEIQEMASQLEAERPINGDASAKTLLKEMVQVPANRKRVLLSIALMICQQLTGANAINYYAPQIFKNLGMSSTDSSLFATGIYGVVKTAAIIIFLVFVADTLGRRRSLIWTSGGQFILMFIIGIYGRIQPPVKGAPVTPFGYVAIACIFLWAALFQFGWGPCCWILISEIPTARLRALNVAIGAATQWLFNFVIARTVLTMQATMGQAGYGMFFMFGCFALLMGTFVFFFVPETKGVSLEKMDELFGAIDSLDKKTGDHEEGRRSDAGEISPDRKP